MGCATPNDDRVMGYVRNMDSRVRALERNLAGFQEITGACTTAGQSVVAVIANVYDPDTGIFTLTWLSTPGQRFQVQESNDAINWTIAENIVTAAADPAIITTWNSAVYALEDFPVYFRVRLWPRVLIPCTPATPACPDVILPVVT